MDAWVSLWKAFGLSSYRRCSSEANRRMVPSEVPSSAACGTTRISAISGSVRMPIRSRRANMSKSHRWWTPDCLSSSTSLARVLGASGMGLPAHEPLPTLPPQPASLRSAPSSSSRPVRVRETAPETSEHDSGPAESASRLSCVKFRLMKWRRLWFILLCVPSAKRCSLSTSASASALLIFRSTRLKRSSTLPSCILKCPPRSYTVTRWCLRTRRQTDTSR
mmetsp:Transcript_57978/g.149215  ORF Transcript_57978/g.149215 Transcript_57978/m.149215 type:complete len:221 (+) Transcript_57978:447-1109(+)